MTIEVGQIYINEGHFGSASFRVITRLSDSTIWSKSCEMDGVGKGEELRTAKTKIGSVLGEVLTADKINAIKHRANVVAYRTKAKNLAREIADKISAKGCAYPQLVAEQLQAILDKL